MSAGDRMRQLVRSLVEEALQQPRPGDVSRRQAIVVSVNGVTATLKLHATAPASEHFPATCLAPYEPVAGDTVWVDFLGADPLVVGRVSVLSGLKSRFAGPTSDYLVAIQDGTARINHYWNSSINPAKRIAGGIDAHALRLQDGSLHFLHSPGAGTAAGDPITWTELLAVDGTSLRYRGGVAGEDTGWVAITDAMMVSPATRYQANIGDAWTPRMRRKNGWVQLAGLVNTNAATDPQHVLTLPPGFRPGSGEFMEWNGHGGSAMRRMDINSSGQVIFRHGNVANSWQSIKAVFIQEG